MRILMSIQIKMVVLVAEGNAEEDKKENIEMAPMMIKVIARIVKIYQIKTMIIQMKTGMKIHNKMESGRVSTVESKVRIPSILLKSREMIHCLVLRI